MKITKIKFGKRIFNVDELSDDFLLWIHCCAKALLWKWEETYNSGKLVHESEWYLKEIARIKKAENYIRKAINIIYIQRKSTVRVKKYGFVAQLDRASHYE